MYFHTGAMSNTAHTNMMIIVYMNLVIAYTSTNTDLGFDIHQLYSNMAKNMRNMWTNTIHTMMMIMIPLSLIRGINASITIVYNKYLIMSAEVTQGMIFLAVNKKQHL